MHVRKGKEFYGDKYEKAIELHKNGKTIQEVAKELHVSYSAAYHWIKGIRKPESSNAIAMVEYLKIEGPLSSVKIMKAFPKHNELFLIASRRGVPIKRVYLGKKYKELATWYYLPGQEDILKLRIETLEKKIEEMKDRLKRAFDQ